MSDADLPRDPDRDDLPPEIAEAEGQLWISGVDPETGIEYVEPITKDELAAGFADARRAREDEDRGDERPS